MAIINGRGRVGIRRSSVIVTPSIQIVSNGLILNYDAGNVASYPGTGAIWYDISGNSRNGTFSGPNGGSASYNIGGYINFDGVDDFIKQSGDAILATDNFTIEVWCRPTSTIAIASESTSGLGALSGQKFIVGPTLPPNYATASGAGLSIGTNGLSVVEHSDTYIPSLLSYNTTISSFTQIVITYTNKQPRAYINGNLVRTGLTSLKGSVYLMLGSIGGMYYGYFAGGLANIKYYNRALSASEVIQNLNAIGPRFFPQVSDSDAQTFVYTAGLTSSTQANAINTLVTSMKAAGIWTKMKALYPFVGGSATSHKWNLKDPRDLDAAFRLQFYGGVNHNGNGIQLSGTNGGAFTYFNPYLRQAKSNLHLSLYTRVRPTRNIYANDINLNTGYSPAGWVALRATSNSQGIEYFGTSDSATGAVGIASTAVGFSIGSRTSSTSIKYYKNANSAAGSGTNNDDFRNSELTLNGNPGGNLYSAGEYAFASMGDGLTDAEAANYYTIVQAFQTSLGRQV